MKELKQFARGWHLGSYLAFAFAFAFAFAPTPAAADFVIDSGVSLAKNSEAFLMLRSDTSGPYSLVTDRFTLESPDVVNRVEWWGYNDLPKDGPPKNEFTIQVFSASETGPTPELVFSQIVGTGRPTLFRNFDFTLNAYSADISGLQLDGGDYYLSISNATTSEPWDDWHWLAAARPNPFNPAGGGGTAFERSSDEDSWSKHVRHYGEATAAFRLRGVTAVPEPASLATLAFCLTVGCGGAGRLWRKRQAQRASDIAESV